MKTRFVLGLILVSVLVLNANEALAQWCSIPDLKYTNIYCFMTANDSTVFVGGDNATLLRSTDNGATWASVMGNGFYVDTVLSLVEGGGYIFAGANGVESVYRSSDNGATWSVANSGLPFNTQVFSMTDVDSNLFAATNYGVYGSSDRGETWQADTAGLNMISLYQFGKTVAITSVGLRLYTFLINQVGWSVYTTTIDTIAWTSVGLDTVPGFAMTAIDTNVFAATSMGVYLYGGGRTWLSRSNGLPYYIPSCILITSDTLLFAYIGSRNGQIYMTSDLGLTWNEINDSVFANASVNAMAATKKYLFAGTQSGGWRIPIADVITSVNDGHPKLPEKFALYQNYPNPFNPTTVINYQLPVNSFVTLKVYDVLGREIATLVNERQTAGTHNVIFNASKLPSGMYFYRLQAGTYSNTKKLLLLK